VTARYLRTASLLCAAALAGLYLLAFLPSAWFRFDDFWQLNASAGRSVPLLDAITTANEADGRWNPGMRLLLRMIAAVSGLERAWPFHLALVGAHAINVYLSVRIAAVLGADARGRWATAFVATAALNLSAYSLVSVFLLHGVVALSFALAAVLSAARYAQDGKTWRLAAAAGATLAGLLCKEYAIVAPLLAAVAVAAAAPGARPRMAMWVRVVAAFAVAGAAFACLQWLAGAPLIPARGRYASVAVRDAGRTLAWNLAHVAVWLALPAYLAWRGPDRRAALRALAIASALVLVAMLPTLALPWRSPGHLYLFLFSTAAGAGLLTSASSPAPSAFRHVWMAAAAAVVTTVLVMAARHQILSWGPLTRQAIADWQAQRQPDDRRVVWFDADYLAPYGGLADLIGPGIRLREALEMTTGETFESAAICIPIVVGERYVAQPGDALFVHEHGRLRRVAEPYFAHATCLP